MLTVKVLHVITGLGDGGAEGVLTRICLGGENVRHVVVSLTDEGKYGSVLRQNGVSVHSLGMTRRLASVFKFFKLIRLIRQEHPDAVQTWMYHSDLVGGLAARLAGIRQILWGIRQSTLERGRAKRLTLIVARLCAVLSYIVPEKIVCCADRVKEIHQKIGYCASKLIVIPNGYDLGEFRVDQQAAEQIRAEFELNKDQTLLGMVGRYHPQKNHRNLFKALSLLQESVQTFRCILVGTGMNTENSKLLSEIKEFGLTDLLILAGPRTDIPGVMSALDLHVLSSSTEGFPNVVAEAMSCETPCVSTDVGDAAAIIADTGLVCPSESPEALARCIGTLLDERAEFPEVWRERQQRCRERIARMYSIERTIAMYEASWNAHRSGGA